MTDPKATRVDELLELERVYDDLPGGADARILAGVELGLGVGPGGGGGGDGSGGGSSGGGGGGALEGRGRLAGWLARAAYVGAGVVAGASGHAMLAAHRAPPDARPPVAIAAVPSASPPAEQAAPAIDAEAGIDPELLPRAAPSAAAPPPPPSTAAERADLDVAREALAHGRPDACLRALERHARLYGDGQFVEERESLWIEALAAAGRRDDAAARAARFHARYPTSLFGPAVDHAIQR